MSDNLDEIQLIDDYLDGKLGKSESKRLLSLLDESDELKKRLVLMSIVDRLLLASRLPPVSGAHVVKAIRASVPLREITPGQHSSVSGLAVALSMLALLIGGGLIWWWLAAQKPLHDPRPVPKIEARVDARPDQIKTEPGRPVVEPSTVPSAVTVVDDQVSASADIVRALYVDDLPDSSFSDDTPAPAGDGSGEPGFVSPPKRPDSPETGSAATSARSTTGSREGPQPPVMFVNLKISVVSHADDSADNLNLLLGELKARLGLSYRKEAKSPDEIDINPENNPVLYVSGHYHFSFTPAQRKTLRKFMLSGGTMVFDTGSGSKPFYDSARRELGIIFRDVSLERFSPSHPLYWSCYELAKEGSVEKSKVDKGSGGLPMLEGVTVRCRAVAMVSRSGMLSADRSEVGIRMGINLAAYVMAWRGWVKSGGISGMMFQEQNSGLADRLRGGQVIYDGGWKPRPYALSMLLDTFSRRTSVAVQAFIREVRLTDPGLFDLPFLYMTGHDKFQLTQAERVALKKYLESGGFLFAESCCGRREFDQAFRTEMKLVFPDKPLMLISPASSIYVEPNPVKCISITSVTPLLAGQLGRLMIEPPLEGVEIGQHYGVVYSQYGMAGGWELSQNPYALGYTDREAIRLGQNIVMYAVTY